MDLKSILDLADSLYHDLTLGSVRDYCETRGAKAIGYMPIYTPREVIHAAGMLPVGIVGAGGQIEIIRGDAYYQSYICQIPRSTIELALSGKLEALDGMLFPATCDVIRNLSGMWNVLFPGKYVRYLDVPQTFDPETGGAFWAHELRVLRDELGERAGRPVSDDALRRSIALYDDNRRAMATLMEIRREEPWRASTYESYLVLRAGNVLPVEEHSKLIRDYCAAVMEADRPVRDHTRVVVVGAFCEQPPLGLIQTLERAGCAIVWDDMMLGARWIEGEVGSTGDPIERLRDAYLTKSVSTAVKYEPNRRRGEYLVDVVRATRAEGVIFAAPSFCDPALLEQPMLAGALDRSNIPWTAFKYAENLGQFQVIREQAGTFADSVRLWSEQ